MSRTVLFVTYGSGHAKMCIPVIRELQKKAGFRIEVLALTLAGPLFAREGIPFFSFRDLVRAGDEAALARGHELAQQHHLTGSELPLEESAAYLGLSYQDLMARLGEAEGERLWQARGRHAFCPVSILERAFDRVRPDILVTTNSPRAEKAAVEVANARGIPSVAMVDLFGIEHFHALEATHITVLCEQVIGHMLQEGVQRPREAFHVLGNPAFDAVFDMRGPIDHAWRAQHLPPFFHEKKLLLWIDVHGYLNRELGTVHIRSDEEIIAELDNLAQATHTLGAGLLVRPHPAQSRAIYHRWFAERALPHAHMVADEPLYPLLAAVDVVATYTSTVSVEATLMEREVVMLRYFNAQCDVPLGEWGMAWLATHPTEVMPCLREALHDTKKAAQKRALARTIMPQQKAAPRIAALIGEVLAGEVSAGGRSAIR